MSGKLNVGVLSRVQNLDPVHAQDFISAMVLSLVFDTPYSRPGKGVDAQPRLFSGPLEADDQRLVFTAPVRADLRFSDGTPLTADLVAESLRRAAPLQSQTEVEASGDRIIFRLKRPNARFDLVLTQTFSAVTLERDGQLLGTGPYLPAPDATPERMRLVRNPHASPVPVIDEVNFVCYPPDRDGRPSALVAALESGEVEFTNVLDAGAVAGLQRVRKQFELGNSTALLYFNTERAELADARVRRALALSIDRLEVARLSHTHALAYTAESLLPPMMSSWRDGISHDLAEAKELIEAAGPAAPKRLTMAVMFGPRPYLPHPRRTADYIAGQLAKLGIEAEIRPTKDSKDYYRVVKGGDYDMMLSGWLADTADPADFLEALLASYAVPDPHRQISIHANLARWRSPFVDEALERLRRDPSVEIEQEILGIAAQEVPAFPLMYGSIAYVHSWRVRGFVPPLLGIPDFAALTLKELRA